jgi:hypothetical protein
VVPVRQSPFPVFPLEPEERTVTLTIEAWVGSGGESVAGAAVACQRIDTIDGERELVTRVFPIAAQRLFLGAELTDEAGRTTTVVRYRESFEEEEAALVGVGACHPQFGTDYVEVDVRELKEDPRVHLGLERGRTARGRVVSEHGRPLPRAIVSISASRGKRYSVSMNGFGTMTDETGEFVLTGIRFENVPVKLAVGHPAWLPSDFETSEEYHAALETTKKMRAKFRAVFDEATQTYSVGDLVFRPE